MGPQPFPRDFTANGGDISTEFEILLTRPHRAPNPALWSCLECFGADERT
jgi:hypothetical protein